MTVFVAVLIVCSQEYWGTCHVSEFGRYEKREICNVHLRKNKWVLLNPRVYRWLPPSYSVEFKCVEEKNT